MVPALASRVLDLNSSVLDGHTLPDTILAHGDSVQPSDLLSCGHWLLTLLYEHSIGVDQSQGFACLAHAVVLTLELELAGFSLLG